MLAGVMSWCITPRRCIPATARASATASPVSSPAGSGPARSARLVPPASASTIDPGYRGATASCATPATPCSRSSIAVSCRSRRSASSPSGSLRMTVCPGKKSRVTRVRALWCTISARTGGSAPGGTSPAPIAHLHPTVRATSILLTPPSRTRRWWGPSLSPGRHRLPSRARSATTRWVRKQDQHGCTLATKPGQRIWSRHEEPTPAPDHRRTASPLVFFSCRPPARYRLVRQIVGEDPLHLGQPFRVPEIQVDQDDQAYGVPDADGQAGFAGRVAERRDELQEARPDAQRGEPGRDERRDAEHRDHRVQRDVE